MWPLHGLYVMCHVVCATYSGRTHEVGRIAGRVAAGSAAVAEVELDRIAAGRAAADRETEGSIVVAGGSRWEGLGDSTWPAARPLGIGGSGSRNK